MQLWLIFALLAFMCSSISTSIDKYFMNNKKYEPLATSTFKMFFDGIVLLVIGLIFFRLNFTFNIFLWSLVVGAMYAFLSFSYFLVLKKKNAGTVIPFYDSTWILFVFLGSLIFLGETANIFNYFGIGLILLGVYLVLSEKIFERPKLDKVVLIVFSMVIVATVYSLLVKKLLVTITPINLAILMYFSSSFFQFIFLMFRKTKKSINLKSSKIFISAFFGAMSIFLLYTALTFGKGSQVFPLQGLNSVFVFLIATFFLKEKLFIHKLIGVMTVFLGIYLVSI